MALESDVPAQRQALNNEVRQRATFTLTVRFCSRWKAMSSVSDVMRIDESGLASSAKGCSRSDNHQLRSNRS